VTTSFVVGLMPAGFLLSVQLERIIISATIMVDPFFILQI
jgi:hypothetical protein